MEKTAKIKELIQDLDLLDKIELESYLRNQINHFNEEIFFSSQGDELLCPHCQSDKVIIWCNYKKGKRFRCKECLRTFTSTTGSIIHHLKKKDKFIRFSALMFKDMFLTTENLSLEIGICQKTAFEWRHRLLVALRDEASEFSGITEMDDVWFLYSQKGRKGLKYSRKRGGSKRRGDNNFQAKLLITKERKGKLDMSLLRIGRIKRKDIERRLKNKFTDDSLLVSDKHPSIMSFAKKGNINHERFISKNHVREELIHVQNVNNIAARLKATLNHGFRGVSTKYLQNYATWFTIKELYKKITKRTQLIINKAVINKNGWNMYTNIEELYKNFIINYSVRTYRCPTKQKWKSQNWNFKDALIGEFL
ncbi:MAG: IS1595 family transposase [bacterium]|nr:IS1595 family transposase [bacterium]